MRVIGLICLLALLSAPLPAQSPAAAKWGGFYDLSEISLEKSEPTLRLSLRLVNLGEEAVQNATVSLTDTLHPYEIHGTFSAVALAAHASADLSAVFQVPRMEAEHWQKGAAPPLFIRYNDAQGRAVKERIALIRMALPFPGAKP